MSDERKAKLPGLTVVSTGNVALDRWMQAVTERLEVREGSRGSDLERVVTQRDLKNGGFVQSTGQRAGSSFSGVMVTGGDGTVGTLPFSVFESELRKTKLYSSLTKRLDDVTRFDDVPEKVRKLLLNDIASEAAKRGADIQRVEYKLQSAEESIAYTLQEVTAAVANASAGVREVTYASATANTATAGKVTQIQARLDDVGGVTIEESMIATADKVTGLEGQYTVKINAGGAVAGFGLAATENLAGATTSSFIVQADKFAVMMPGLGNAIPFGVDAGGVYINGNLRVNAGGTTLTNSAGKYTDYIFRRSAAAPATPTGNTPASWSDTPPSGTDPLYMSKGEKTAVGVLIGAWSAPVRLDGVVGASGQYTESQYGANSSSTSSAGVTFTSTQPTLSTGQFMWMQIRTVTPPTEAGLWGTAVRISGEKGNPGADSTVPGTPGVRGSVSRYLVGTVWSNAAANASLPGGSAINGDLVTIGSGSFISTKTYNGSSWNPPGVIIDGSLIASGSITASSMFANTFTGYTFTGSIFQTAASGARVVMSYTDNAIKVYGSDGSLMAQLYGNATNGTLWTSADSPTSAALYALQTGIFPTMIAYSMHSDGVGIWATGKIAVKASGQIYQSNGGTGGQWNNYTNSVLPVANNAFYSGFTGNVWAGIYSQTAVVVTSDARKKKDIEDCDLGLDFIDALRPVTYRMIEGHQEATFAPGESALTKDENDEFVQPTITIRPGSRRHYGLLAQEVKAAIGNLDCGFWTIEDVSDADSAQGLRYEELIAPMLKAIQELSARVKTLEAQP